MKLTYPLVNYDFKSGLLASKYTRWELLEAKDVLEYEKKKVNHRIEHYGRSLDLESKLIEINEILCEVNKKLDFFKPENLNRGNPS